ncbi:MFS transporter [Lichenicola sp.]|uniref:MFS transporter n=1 Tax=Lichenicola sp. TaxID=2804529 RepID=UPI003B00B662
MTSLAQSQCDRTAVHARAEPVQAPYPRLVLATCILASSLAFVDGSVVNVALPAIGHALDAPASGLQWIVNGYLLPLSALLLLGGAAADRWGRRPLLLAGILLFGLASLACALAPGLPTLVAARILQGCGAAMLMPTSLAVLGDTFSGEARGRAIGIWAATGAIAGAVGPMLGGVLVDTVGWRAVFLINLPLAGAALVLARRAIPATPASTVRKLDLSGALFATAGLGLVSWALTEGSGRLGWSASVAGGAGVGVIALLLFLVVERRRGDAAMMPLAMFGSTSFTGLTLLTLLVYGALGGLFVLLPFVLIQAGGYSAAMAGAALLPLPLLLAVLSPLAGSMAGRVGPRLPLTIGPAIVAAGFVMMLRISPPVSYWTDVLPALLTVSIGLAGAVAPLTSAVLGSVGADYTGSASGLNSAVARTGGLVATALIGPVLAATGSALVGAFHVATLCAAGSCLAGALAAFCMIRRASPGTQAH